ncbi:EAL domain-containing protein [Microbulbifer sp. 2201CG32-9]|uniref:EAL domain-containing protein n=1 Tax=Microbulbifer sp. 2201CG32-9 TaxID=3232309 RepID=UPI00345C5C85
MTEFNSQAADEPLGDRSAVTETPGFSLTAADAALAEVADSVIVTDYRGLVTYINPLAQEMLGGAVRIIPGQPLGDVLHLRDSDGNRVWPVCRHPGDPGGEVLPVARELRAALKPLDGRESLEVTVQLLAVRDDPAPQHLVLVIRDTSAARRLSFRLSWQTSHDTLTRLANRQFFESELQQAIVACVNKRSHQVLLYLDIYQFKLINDTLGYAAGDKLLALLPRQLESCLSARDLFARVGSDEFAILLRDRDVEEAGPVVSRLRQAVQDFVFHWNGSESRVAVSIGAVAVDWRSPPAGQLLASANDACRAAREQGRNRVKLFSDARKALEQHREKNWVVEIGAALRENRLLLFRQPVVALQQGGDLHHYEILVRMRSREGDVIAPGRFLPAAERYGLIEEVDRWVIRQVFAYMAAEQAQGIGGFGYAVNISGISLGDETLADYVLSELTSAGVAPARVQFEITETSAIDNLDRALIFIYKLRAAGCSFALDDFGCGASSLAYLRQLPVDYLKIDGSFVRNMLIDEIDSAMVSTVDHLAKCMGVRTIAEFVETPQLQARLRDMGVDFAQGFGIAAASPLPELGVPEEG